MTSSFLTELNEGCHPERMAWYRSIRLAKMRKQEGRILGVNISEIKEYVQ
jgi:hypothetical protein